MPKTPSYPVTESIKQYLYLVYAWMMIAFGISAGGAYFIYNNATISAFVLGQPWLIVFIVILWLATESRLPVLLNMHTFVAGLRLIIYSLFIGITFYTILKAFIPYCFAIFGMMFGVTALYGYWAKADLTSRGSYFYMIGVGLMLALFVSQFWINPRVLAFILVSVICIVLVVFLTTKNMQRLVLIGHQLQNRQEPLYKLAIIGALSFYQDLINYYLEKLQIYRLGRVPSDFDFDKHWNKREI